MKDNADKARSLDAAELGKQLRDSKEQMFRLRFQMSLGQADGLKKLRQLRKERARMLTVQRERELGLEVAPAASKATKAGKEAKPAKAAAAKPATKKAAVKKAAPKAKKAAKVTE